ncbi:alpha amylase catalytic region [Paenibacillus curdlanolyticus YK9]|uniref:Alpha amylase catalytic region n=1 Tax=Paenibacillus curdlanolyticus YK9 TaxID=717606 RepID=E0ICK3_9BACL|nr:glycoside hydrolase family 13 protein [Paenibacillus curdlanolyticus]EFM09889.1 alpha amylase catalytic region [Paenibacillus curdlanolyticus YK9]
MPSSIHHVSEPPYAYPLDEYRLKVRLKVKRGSAASCEALYADRYDSPGSEQPILMEKIGNDRYSDYYEAVLPALKRKVRYLFLVRTHAGESYWVGERCVSAQRELAGSFQFPYICRNEVHAVPDWAPQAVFYQIFPDRFHNGDPSISPAEAEPWNSEVPPTPLSLYGGDLQGIIDKLDHLVELGINAMYLNPIFRSPSNHKYNTSNYYEIDPSFGSMETFKQFVKQAHERGIRVVLDAVFNHSGDAFFAFQDVVENGDSSKYRDWYFIDSTPIVKEPAPNYETFGNAETTMPKLNTACPAVADYFLDVAEYWIRETGIDGWRLDVANEVDRRFWRLLRERIKGIDDQLLLVGEFMHDAAPWLHGDQFDGVMNYLFREAALDFFARQTIGAETFTELLVSLQARYTEQAFAAMMQLLGSHDTERFLTACRNGGRGWNKRETAASRMQLAICLQMTMPGMPVVYYGDEVGMHGDNDPDCRKPMVWEEQAQDRAIFDTYRTMIALRKKHASLTSGSMRIWFVDEANNAFGFIRRTAEETAFVVINNGFNPINVPQLNLEGTAVGGSAVVDGISGERYTATAAGEWGAQQPIVKPFGCTVLIQS